MIEFLRRDRWSPYLVGALIGVLLTVLFTLGYQFGVSSGISRVAALAEQALIPGHIDSTPYFLGQLADQVIFNWKILFLIGMLFGAWIASRITKDPIPAKNTIWKEAFGDSKLKRHIGAFIGGMLLLIGARIADGCTSGHAICGGAQLSLTSWVFMMAVFATAIPTAFILYNKKARI